MASSDTVTISNASGDGSRASRPSRNVSDIACGNLGALPNPPNRGSNWVCMRATAKSSTLGSTGSSVSGMAERGTALDLTGKGAGLLEQVVAFGAPRVVDGGEHAWKAGHPRTIGVGEVGAAVERSAVGVEEHGHRPAAATDERLHRVHVDGVDVGPLLPVDLHVHEVRVHLRRDVGVLEGLVRHHVAPVTRRVPDRQQHRLVLGACLGERFVAPRVPVDRVVRMLAQVGRCLVLEPVHASQARAARACGCRAVASVGPRVGGRVRLRRVDVCGPSRRRVGCPRVTTSTAWVPGFRSSCQPPSWQAT